jgi:hypothetical protein
MNSSFLKPWLLFTVSFLSFPAAGIAGGLVIDRVSSTITALIGGLVTGAVIGAGQSLASSGRLDPRRWIPASTAGMGIGLAAGASAAGFGTALSDLALMGAITGLALGLAQALALPGRASTGARVLWAAAMPALWALGWTITTVAGVQVEEQFTVFGSTGAITVSALAGLLLHLLAPVATPATGTHPSTTPIGEQS